jgi:glycosyltransferase involved in cell wall biosynthesis
MLLETLERMPYWETAVRGLSSQGWRVTLVAVQRGGPMVDVLEDCLAGSASLGARSAHDYPRAALRLARLLRRRGGGVLHCSGEVAGAVGGLAGLMTHSWVVLGHRHHIRSGVPPLLQRMAARLPAHTMTCSRAAFDAALAEGARPSRVQPAVNGVPDPRPVAAHERVRTRARAGAGPEDVVVTLVARLRPGKGHATLLAAAGELEAELQGRLVLLFVGDGPERHDIEAQAAASPVRTCLAGHASDLAPFLAAADVVVVPSDIESFGLTAAEAMAAGRPLVVSDVAGLREVVGGEDAAWLVPVGSAHALAGAVRAVLTDPEAAARKVAAARTRYEQLFTAEAMTQRWIAVYDSLLPSR